MIEAYGEGGGAPTVIIGLTVDDLMEMIDRSDAAGAGVVAGAEIDLTQSGTSEPVTRLVVLAGRSTAELSGKMRLLADEVSVEGACGKCPACQADGVSPPSPSPSPSSVLAAAVPAAAGPSGRMDGGEVVDGGPSVAVSLLLAAMRRRHEAGGLTAHSLGCEVDLSQQRCTCGALVLAAAYRRVLDEVQAEQPDYQPPVLGGDGTLPDSLSWQMQEHEHQPAVRQVDMSRTALLVQVDTQGAALLGGRVTNQEALRTLAPILAHIAGQRPEATVGTEEPT